MINDDDDDDNLNTIYLYLIIKRRPTGKKLETHHPYSIISI